MKLRHLCLAAAAAALFVAPAHAQKKERKGKDELMLFSLAEFKANPKYKDQLEGFRYTFGNSISGQKIETLSSRKMTRKGRKRTPQEACEWALLSALMSFQDAASNKGASAVHGLKSIATEAGPYSSTSQYQCRVGRMMVRVYLQGTLVK